MFCVKIFSLIILIRYATSDFRLVYQRRFYVNNQYSIFRKFLDNGAKTVSTSSSRTVLTENEKFDFVKTSVSWIEGKDIMDTCFVLNFGYEAPLPWPQVSSHYSLSFGKYF